MPISKWVVAVLLAVLPLCSVAEDFGTVAPTFQTDADGRDQLRSAMREKQKDGELDRYWKNYRKRVIDSIINPPPLGIPSSTEHQVIIAPVKFVVPVDWRDNNGSIVVHKGTVIYPLRVRPLNNGLIFIDGRDQGQVDYAIKKASKIPLKIVLTAGSYYNLRVRYRTVAWHGGVGIPFYFDQRKMIINSLNNLYGIKIDRVPAMLTQQDDNLRIEFGMAP